MESIPRSPPDWQLPPGVNRGLWDYLHDPAIAANYDASLAGSSLLTLDVAFVQRHCPPGARVIDLGCGTGRLLPALAGQGCRVVGVDLSAPMLRVAAARVRHAGSAVALLQANLTELGCLADQSFDCAACLFSTLGMIRGRDHRATNARPRPPSAPAGRRLYPARPQSLVQPVERSRTALAAPERAAFLARPGGAGDRLMPTHQGIAGLTLHLFTRGEALALLRNAGFAVREVRPVSLRRTAGWCVTRCLAGSGRTAT